MTQNNLGNALREQGIRTGGKAGAELLSQAVTAYREALTVYTRESLPQHWAATQNNLGIALFIIGGRKKNIDTLNEAQKAILESYSFYKENGNTLYNKYFDKILEAIDKCMEELP